MHEFKIKFDIAQNWLLPVVVCLELLHYKLIIHYQLKRKLTKGSLPRNRMFLLINAALI